jgi:hypothetical protein
MSSASSASRERIAAHLQKRHGGISGLPVRLVSQIHREMHADTKTDHAHERWGRNGLSARIATRE